MKKKSINKRERETKRDLQKGDVEARAVEGAEAVRLVQELQELLGVVAEREQEVALDPSLRVVGAGARDGTRRGIEPSGLEVKGQHGAGGRRTSAGNTPPPCSGAPR